VVGIEKAQTVIAINSDPDAPIFDHADYCIVGDAYQIIPSLIAALDSPSNRQEDPVLQEL